VIARRLSALVVAIGLIAGAWLVRSRVIDDGDDGAGADGSGGDARELVCARDLESICASLQRAGLDVTVEDASATLDRLRDVPTDELPLWLTVDPYPAMLDSLRTGARADPAAWTTTEVASSPIALVSPTEKAASLETACPEPDRWQCVGDVAGDPWAELDPALDDTVRPAFAPVDRYAVGLVALGQATAGWFGSDPIDTADPTFFAWFRGMTGQVSDAALSGGTPIRTILTRPSALDVAVGAQAELGPTPDARFGVTYAGPMTRADVVLAAPDGVDVPSDLAATLAAELTAGGWEPASDEPSGVLPPTTLLALQTLWEDVSR
jgi:hypothetical protein